MPISIRPFTRDWVAAVRDFNNRLKAGGTDTSLLFPDDPEPVWLPKRAGCEIYQEYFLAVDDGTVRGGFILKRQPFWIAGRLEPLTFYHGPISEGIVDRSFATVGVLMLRAALKASPRLFALGMGGLDQPLPMMLKALGWTMELVPFRFWIRSSACFRELPMLNRTVGRRLAMRLAAWTGTGLLGVRSMQALRARRPGEPYDVDLVESFGGRHAGWVDEVWDRTRADYALIGARDHRTLEALYPAREGRFIRLRVRRGDRILGWVVLLDTRMHGGRHFGNLRLGSIVDGLAGRADVLPVVWAARHALVSRGVDLIVTNQSHEAWDDALARAGFLNGPSNFVFAASKALAADLGPAGLRHLHMTRGDGDGPIHL